MTERQETDRERTPKYRWRDAYRHLRNRAGYGRLTSLLLTLPATTIGRLGRRYRRQFEEKMEEEKRKAEEARQRSEEIDNWNEVVGRDR